MSVRLLCCLSGLVGAALLWATPFAAAAPAPGDLPAAVHLPLTAIQYRALGQAALTKHLPRKAAGFFTLALLQNPRDVASLRGRAQAYTAAGDDARAQADMARLLTLVPGDTSILMRRGQTREANGDTVGALADYTSVLAVNSQNADALDARAALFRTLGDYARAVTDDDQLVTLRPGPASLMQRADDKRAAGQWAGAADDYKAASGLSASPEASLGLGYCLLRLGQYSDAQTATQDALGSAPSRPDVLLQSGLLNALLGQQTLALAQWNAALPVASPDARADAALSLSQCLRSRPDDPALLSLLHLLENAPHSSANGRRGIGGVLEGYRTSIGGVYGGGRQGIGVVQGRYREGIGNGQEVHLRLTAQVTPSAESWIAQGRADANAGLPILALADWARAATLDPANPDVYDVRGAFHAGRSEWEAALPDTTRAVQSAPTPPRLNAQGDAFLHLGRHAEAARAYSRALSLSVDNTKTATDYMGDAQSAEASGNGERAAALYAQALRLDPANADALRHHQALFLAWGDTDTALTDASALIALSPGDPQGYAGRADILRQKGDWAGALADATQVVTLAPQDAAAWLARGVTYSQQAEGLTGTETATLRQKAIADFTQSLALDPNNVKALGARGTTWYAQADYDRALADLNKAIDLGAGFSVAFLFRANIYAQRGQDTLALSDFTRAAQLDPSDARAYVGRAAALRRLGRASEAAADDAKAKQLTP